MRPEPDLALMVVGANIRSAPLAWRERLAFPSARVPAGLRALKAALPGAGLLLVSTCNRTELYVVGSAAADEEAARGALLAAAGVAADEAQGPLYCRRGVEAVQHLMAVATSLDSLIVGETEILGQVKAAYQQAVEAGTASQALHVVVQHVLHAAKRVRHETDLSRGRVSVGSIAVDLAGRLYDDLADKVVLVIGAGTIGHQALAFLVARGVRQAWVANRGSERGEAVAQAHGARRVAFDDLSETLPQADIVISATSAPQWVVTADLVRAAMARRHGRPMLIIDLAVPRDVEPTAGRLENVYLYHLDDLEEMAAANLAKRRGAVAQAREIIAAEAAGVAAAVRAGTLGVGEIMRHLDESVAAIVSNEMARAFAKQRVAPFGEPCEACRAEIETMLHRALAKMVAGPKKALMEAAQNGAWDEMAASAARLYGIPLPTADRPAEESQ